MEIRNNNRNLVFCLPGSGSLGSHGRGQAGGAFVPARWPQLALVRGAGWVAKGQSHLCRNSRDGRGSRLGLGSGLGSGSGSARANRSRPCSAVPWALYLCCLSRFTRYKELGMLIPAQTCASYPTFGRITAPLVFRGP